MNIIKLHDIKLTHRNPLHSYTLTMRKIYKQLLKLNSRKILELINVYSKVAGSKINTQKFLALLYTNSEKI